jgi:hypothetical protein
VLKKNSPKPKPDKKQKMVLQQAFFIVYSCP